MALPKYWELYGPLLSALLDGDIHKKREISAKIAEQLHLTDAELAELLPSGAQTVFENRAGISTRANPAWICTCPLRS